MSNFYMMCGLPASGKTMHIDKNILKSNLSNKIKVHSSDKIREELFGDESIQKDNEKVFNLSHKRVLNDLKLGYDVVYDATNINYKRRIHFLNSINVDCKKICILMNTPYHICLQNQNNRERKVPENVIYNMYKNFTIPYYYEGWDNIRIIDWLSESQKDRIDNLFYGANGIIYFNQHNSHHSLTLGEHCLKVAKYVYDNFDNCDIIYPDDVDIKTVLYEASLLHDIGKTKTMTFYNHNNERTEDAHYYQHDRIGAYDSLNIECDGDRLLRAILIMWHMQPYFNKEDKTKRKYENLWGENLTKCIYLLHHGDKNAK